LPLETGLVSGVRLPFGGKGLLPSTLWLAFGCGLPVPRETGSVSGVRLPFGGKGLLPSTLWLASGRCTNGRIFVGSLVRMPFCTSCRLAAGQSSVSALQVHVALLSGSAVPSIAWCAKVRRSFGLMLGWRGTGWLVAVGKGLLLCGEA
jgi:hypothetical protein